MRNFLLLIGLLLSLFSYSQTVNLTLKVTNIEEVKGNISIAIFNNSEGFPSGDNYYAGKKIPVKSKEFAYKFKDIVISINLID